MYIRIARYEGDRDTKDSTLLHYIKLLHEDITILDKTFSVNGVTVIDGWIVLYINNKED